MKTIFIIICLGWFQHITSAQVLPFANMTHYTGCTPVYSEDTKSLVFNSSASNPCHEIIIENLPSASQPSAMLELNLSIKGSFSFKKSKDLIIPDNYRLVIEDVYTGNSFILDSSEPHSFSISRPTYKKFILRLYKINAQAMAKAI